METIALGLGLVDPRMNWRGGNTHLLQLGDLFNRGGGARQALKLLVQWHRQALRHDGRVTMLLGNHEVLTSLGVEAWCTTEEYLSFATPEDRETFEASVQDQRSFLFNVPPNGPILPLAPRLEAWRVTHAPGRQALREAFRSSGEVGRVLRQLPVAVKTGRYLFSHAPITPRWARLGVQGLTDRARREWREAPSFFRGLPLTGLFRSSRGPLWNRDLALKETVKVRRQLLRSLALLDADRMITGHTATEAIPGGEPGRIALRHGGRLVCIDVGLGSGVPAALVIEGARGWEWRPDGARTLWE